VNEGEIRASVLAALAGVAPDADLATVTPDADLRREFDLAVSCPNSFSQALLLRLAGIPRRLGWSYGGRGFLLTDKLVPEMRGRRRPRARVEPGVLDQKKHRRREVMQMNPREPLAAVADRPSDEGFEGREHLGHGTAAPAQDYPQARQDHPRPFCQGGQRLPFPIN